MFKPTTTTGSEPRRWQGVSRRALGDLLRTDLLAIDCPVGVHPPLVDCVPPRGGADTTDDVRARWQARATGTRRCFTRTRTAKRRLAPIGVLAHAQAHREEDLRGDVAPNR